MITYAQKVEFERRGKVSRQKVFARSQLTQAIKSGKVIKESCYCGETKVEGHHPDYSKSLQVIWACKKHHAMLDKMRREEEITLDTGIVIH